MIYFNTSHINSEFIYLLIHPFSKTQTCHMVSRQTENLICLLCLQNIFFKEDGNYKNQTYFRIKYGLVNAINTYLRLKICFCWEESLTVYAY